MRPSSDGWGPGGVYSPASGKEDGMDGVMGKRKDWRVCSNTVCSEYGKRYYSPYCAACGSEMALLEKCCAEESMEDTGFCRYCGKKKNTIKSFI